MDPNSEILISNKIIDDLEKYFETNKFIITDKIIFSMTDYRNYNFNDNSFSYLKNIQNTKDYNIRLYQKENELLEQLSEYENKNNSIKTFTLIFVYLYFKMIYFTLLTFDLIHIN